MSSKIVIAALLIVIAMQAYGNVSARNDDATVGDIDCMLYDVDFNGWHVDELRAIGYLTEIDD